MNSFYSKLMQSAAGENFIPLFLGFQMVQNVQKYKDSFWFLGGRIK